MDFDEYQVTSHHTAIYPRIEYQEKNSYRMIEAKWVYPLLGLSGEVGELQNKLKKIIRDNKTIDVNDLMNELGDILWYVSELATIFDLELGSIAIINLRKLKDRANRDVIKGSGDTR